MPPSMCPVDDVACAPTATPFPKASLHLQMFDDQVPRTNEPDVVGDTAQYATRSAFICG